MASSVWRICGKQIRKHEIITHQIDLPAEDNFLILGKVYAKSGKPLPNAGIVVYKVDPLDGKQEYIALTFSLEDGSYGVVVPRNYDYQLVCYP